MASSTKHIQLKEEKAAEMILYLILACIILPLVALVVVYVRSRRERQLINKIPGPESLPVLGSTVILKSKGEDIFDRLTELSFKIMDSGIYRVWFGMHPMIIVYEASIVESLCCSSKHLSKSYVYKFLMPWLGTGLLTSTGDKWKSRRKMLTPAFHFKILEEFVEVFNEQSAKLVSIMDSHSEGDKFDIQPLLTRCTLDVIGDTAMGFSIGALDNRNAQYVNAIYRLSDTLMTRFISLWLWPDALFKLSKLGKIHDEDIKILHDFTNMVIQERRARLLGGRRDSSAYVIDPDESSSLLSEDDIMFGKKKRKQRLAFLDLLLEVAKDDPNMTDRDIQEEVDTFMFEGHDTTSAAASWIMYTVSNNKDVQKRLHEELDQVVGRDDRPLSIEDLNKLKYMECVVKETMRLYPAVPFISREISEDCQLGGYTVPKGTIASILSNVLHRDPKQFPNPDQFDPDRWLENNGRHPYSFIPFSAGPRSCIGQRFAMLEEKMILSHILRKFELTCEEKEVPSMCELVLRPKFGLKISVKRRENLDSL